MIGKRSFANGNGPAACSHANGNAPSPTDKTQRDSGFDIKPESHWTLVLGI